MDHLFEDGFVIFERMMRADIVCRIFGRVGILVFCIVWLLDYCRSSVCGLCWRLMFFGRGSRLRRNHIFCPCWHRQRIIWLIGIMVFFLLLIFCRQF